MELSWSELIDCMRDQGWFVQVLDKGTVDVRIEEKREMAIFFSEELDMAIEFYEEFRS